MLNIFQDRQNVLGALKGLDSDTFSGQLAQQFNLNDEAGLQGVFKPSGCLEIPLNLLLSYRYYFDHGLRLEFHLPIIHAELKNVEWCPLFDQVTQEEELAADLIKPIGTVGGLCLNGWKRTGIGDFVVQAAWMRDFPQCRTLLQNVRTQARFGVIFPTGKREDEDLVLAFPFGNDGAWALQFGGGIDLNFGYTMRGGIDVEFIYQFGNTRCRRVKSAQDQTDLLFLTKVPVYREFGLGQQYNIYLESCNLWCNTSLKLNYQLLKRNDDRIDVANDRIDSRIANNAESLFDWTAHSLIFMVRHDLWRDYECTSLFPTISAFVKWGFNGKRALLANTAGIEISVAF